MAGKNVKNWLDVVEPHEDIRKGNFDESVFAADLGKVADGTAPEVYSDARTFFAKTYLTKGLENLLETVAKRLSGKKAEPVIQLVTSFGGGKTHTLLAAYHLAKNNKQAESNGQVKALVEKAGIKHLPEAKVVLLDGSALNPVKGRKTKEGIVLKTLWGELAYQLGGEEMYKEYAQNDELRTAIGSSDVSEMLKKSGPCLILADEFSMYIEKASAVEVKNSNLGAQSLAFVQALTQAVSGTQNAMLIATLPASHQERMGPASEEAYQKLKRVFERVSKSIEPVVGEEIYEVIRRRLFEQVGDEKEREKVADLFYDYYQDQKRDLSREVLEPEYRKKIMRAYPFHPSLIDLLYERWGTLPGFQRTRRVLSLLALVIGDLYEKRHGALLIQPSHVNLANPEIRAEFISYTGTPFLSVIDTDIAGPTSKAFRLDKELGSEYARERIIQGLATSIFLYSFTGGEQKGAGDAVLRVAVLHPNIVPTIFSDALDRLDKDTHFLSSKGGVYAFRSQPNLNKLLVETESTVKEDDVLEYIQGKTANIIGSRFRNFLFPQETRDVADVATASLVVLPLSFSLPSKEAGTKDFILDIIKNCGHSFRKYPNSLVFVAADNKTKNEVYAVARRALALKKINDEYGRSTNLTPEQKAEVLTRMKEIEVRVPNSILVAYRHVLTSNQDKSGLKEFDLGSLSLDSSSTLSEKVAQTLKDNETLLDRLDPALLDNKRFGVWSPEQKALNLKELWHRFHQLTHLPLIENDNVLREAIAVGIQRKLFVVGYGDEKKFDKIVYESSTLGADIDLSETAWLIRRSQAVDLLPKEAPPEVPQIQDKPTLSSHEGLIVKSGTVLKVQSVEIQATPDWRRWQEFYDEVIEPLISEGGAKVEIQVNIKAHSTEGIPKDVIETRIKENLTALRIKNNIEIK